MATLEEYYQTIYLKSCDPHQSFLASPHFFVNACHLGTLFMLILSGFTLFLMLKKSPATMKSAIPYMVHLHIWTMTCDFMFAVMVLPYFFLPLVAGYPFGLMMLINIPPKIQLWLAFGALGGMCAAILSVFEHRFRSIVSNSKFVMKEKSTRNVYNIFMYGYHINFGVPILLTMPDDQEHTKLENLKSVPCPPPEYFDEWSFVIQLDGRTLFNPYMYFTCFSMSSVALFYCLQIFWFLLPANNPSMSPATRKLQRGFFFAMCIQIAIPVFVILAPNIYWNLSITFRFYSQEGNNLSVFFFTLHGISASIAIMTLYAPYRKYIKEIVLRYVFCMDIAKSSAPISVVAMTSRTWSRKLISIGQMAASLQEYYERVYPKVCNATTFFASPDFLFYSCRLGSLFTISFSSFAIFLMLTKSPPSMKSAIPHMVHFHIWILACDLVFSVLALPYFFYPLVAAHTFGILKIINVPPKLQIWLCFGALAGMGAAMISLLEHRFRSIVTNSKFVMSRKSTRFVYYLVLYGYHINFGIPEILTMPEDQDQLKFEKLQIIPCPPEEYFNEWTLLLQKDGRTLFNPHMYFTILSMLSFLLFYFFQIVWFLSPSKNPAMSPITRKLQRNFFISMCIQTAIPLGIIAPPNIYWNLSISFQFYSQELNNLSVIIFTLHGVSASIGVMFLYAPYRKYIKEIMMKYFSPRNIEHKSVASRISSIRQNQIAKSRIFIL